MTNETIETQIETRCLSSLAKVFADAPLSDDPVRKMTCLGNETVSFQVAYRSNRLLKGIRVRLESDLSEYASVRAVGLAPSELTMYPKHDENVLRTEPGLYPDPLFPIDGDGVAALPNQWRSLWVTIDVPAGTAPGARPVRVLLESESGEPLGEETFELEVLAASLPEQTLIHTEWFHTDCIATYYRLDVFSEAHWAMIDKFVQTAVKHGINMILTPLFTPPLDTAVGGERPTVQLVDVTKTGDAYEFGFEKLTRWIDLCRSRGIRYFELSHLFTQWGAKHAPKIVATEDGVTRRIFGWDTDAAGEEYKSFLSQFIPALTAYLKERGLEDSCYFHVSDEPNADHLESYRSASGIVRQYADGFPMIDALSDYSFYKEGLVKQPVPGSNHIEEFLENQVPNLWTYYCCSQFQNVSNRFFCFPSARNRIIGMQLFKYDIAGFLHWGYNFWYSQYSKRPIDPFRETDAGYAFPSGDAFLVYPGEDGPIESIRMEVFYEALQDLRALRLLQSFVGKEEVITLLEDRGEITFDRYPTDAEWLLAKRDQINRAIARCVAEGRGSQA